MTDNQRDKLNRFLAERVLGWTVTAYYCYPPGLSPESNVAHYRLPTFESLADCEPLLNKIERDGWKWMLAGEMFVGRERYEFAISKGTGGTIISQASSSRTEALRLAVGRAYGWKVEG